MTLWSSPQGAPPKSSGASPEVGVIPQAFMVYLFDMQRVSPARAATMSRTRPSGEFLYRSPLPRASAPLPRVSKWL